MPTIAYPTLVTRGGDLKGRALPADTRIRLVRMSDPGAFTDAATPHLFGLVIATAGLAKTRALLNRLLLSSPDLHLVVVLREDASHGDVEAVAKPRIRVCRASAAPSVLLRALRHTWFDGRREAIRRIARTRRIPVVVQCAVSQILDQRVPMSIPESGDAGLVRTLGRLATLCGTHRDTLRRASHRSGVDLRALMRTSIVALALHERFVVADPPRSTPWARIARRCGYDGAAGLRALVAREFGVGFRDLDLDDLQQALDRLGHGVAGDGTPA